MFCTTDPQKIPGTILSRVQRYNFQRISKDGIIKRLTYIINQENNEGSNISFQEEALDYIAKQAQGGMRDAITTLDKCLAYNKYLSLENVVNVLSAGVTPYDLSKFTKMLLKKDTKSALEQLNNFFMSGIDMGLLVINYFEFLLNLQKYLVLGGGNDVSSLPLDLLTQYKSGDADFIRIYLQKLYTLINAPKMDIKSLLEAWVIERCI